MYYYLSIGSNIDPRTNASKIIRQLADNFGPLISYPFLSNAPLHIPSKRRFLNSVAILKSDQPPESVKAILNRIEITLGRDRSDPERSLKDRTADIDILGWNKNLNPDFFKQFTEPYINFFGVIGNRYEDLSAEGLPSPQRPAAIDLDRNTGQICILDDSHNGLKDWQEPSLETQ